MPRFIEDTEYKDIKLPLQNKRQLDAKILNEEKHKDLDFKKCKI